MNITYDFGEDFEYEVDYDKLREALVEILCKETKYKHKSLYNEDGAYQMAKYVVYDLDLVDTLCEVLEEDLYNYFYDDAQEEYYECEELSKESDDWYGTINDVRGI